MTLEKPQATLSRYTFVTVLFRDDDGLMALQARSLRKYLDPALVYRIIVIDHPHRAHAYRRRDALRAEYGALAPIVRFVDARRLVDMPHYVSGWFAQQIIKLLVARIIRTDRYVVLDAKNHLVAPFARHHLEAPDGRLLVRPMDYTGHVMRDYFESTFASLGVDPTPHIAHFFQTTTPFAFPTDDVCRLIDDIETHENAPFAEAFCAGNFSRTEFFLFGAHLIANGKHIATTYDLTGPKYATIWPELTTAQTLTAIAANKAAAHPVFAVHRRAIPTMSETSRNAIATYWQNQGLFKTTAAGETFLAQFTKNTTRTRRSDRHIWRLPPD